MMIKQAMILAAGKGTRMRPLTLTTPKPLVPVADKPLIFWHIQRLHLAGIRDIVINVGYLGEKIKQALLKSDFGVNIKISDESGFSEPLETAGGVRYALANKLLDDSPFLLINGDVWTEFDFNSLINYDLQDDLAHLILTKNPHHNPNGDFVLSDNNKIALKDEQSSCDNCHTFAGISLLSPDIVADVQNGEIAPLAPKLKNAIAYNKVTGQLMRETWVDVGTLERLAWVDNYARLVTLS